MKQQNILLVGAGKMGKLILRELESLPDVAAIYVCDIAFNDEYTEGKTSFFCDITRIKDLHIDAAFIAATASAHFDLLKTLISFGIRNIFVEKPAVLNMEEYDGILAISDGYNIATGYILRHADSVAAMKKLIDEALAEGFCLEKCNVNYEKYLPVTAEPRAMTDLGVFDETPHIWDLLFNYLGYKDADSFEMADVMLDYEEIKPDRAIETTITYALSFKGKDATVKVHSSFRSKERIRTFEFVYSKGDAKRTIFVDLDKPENRDIVSLIDEAGTILYNAEFPSLTKIHNEINDVMHFFATGEKSNVALFETEKTVLDLYNKVK